MAGDLVTVRRFYTGNDAEMAKMILEAEGIRTFVADAMLISMDWLYGNAVGWVKVQVPSADADRATEILAAWRPPPKLDKTTALSLLILGLPVKLPAGTDALEKPLGSLTPCLQCGQTMPDQVATCPACGWTYETEPKEDDKASADTEWNWLV